MSLNDNGDLEKLFRRPPIEVADEIVILLDLFLYMS